MSHRQWMDAEGGLFQLHRYVWRSAPAIASFPDGAIRCVVGQDKHGWFRAGMRLGRDEDGGEIQMIFAPDRFPDKQRAIEFSREMTRDFITDHAECYAEHIKGPLKPGEQIIKVQMDDGWSVEINAPGKLSPLETKLKELSERNMADGEARPAMRSQEIDR